MAAPSPVQHFNLKIKVRLAAIDRPSTWLCSEIGISPQALHNMKNRNFPDLQRLRQISSILGLGGGVDLFFEQGLPVSLLKDYAHILGRKATSKDRARVRLEVMHLEVQDLSERIGLQNRSMSQWLRSDHEAQDEKLLTIAPILELPVDVLRDAEDYPAALLNGWEDFNNKAQKNRAAARGKNAPGKDLLQPAQGQETL